MFSLMFTNNLWSLHIQIYKYIQLQRWSLYTDQETSKGGGLSKTNKIKHHFSNFLWGEKIQKLFIISQLVHNCVLLCNGM